MALRHSLRSDVGARSKEQGASKLKFHLSLVPRPLPLNREEGVTGRLLYPAGALFFIICILYILTRPVLLVEGDGKVLFTTTATAGMQLSTRFIHSVQKTPVEEYFIVNEDCSGFVLNSTRYHSFGVGLPFLESDGAFRREGDSFIMDNLDRPIEILELRPGVGTELSLTVEGQRLPLYEMVPLGSLVRVSIVPRWVLYFKESVTF